MEWAAIPATGWSIYAYYTMHIQCICQRYTLYIPKIYYIYTKYIQCIYRVYTIYIYILGVCNVYTKDNDVVYTMNILGIYLVYQIPTGICMVYTWYMHDILHVYAVLNDMSCIYLVKTSWVCSVPFFIMIYI